MSATVDTTIALPRRQAAPGGEIVRTDGRQGGLRQIARAQNTLCEQHRGPLVSAASANGAPILTGTGQIARFRAKLQPRLGYQNEIAGAYVDILVTGGSATVQCRFDDAAGGTTTLSVALSAAARALRSLSGGGIADDAEFTEVELEIAANTATTVEVYGLELEYGRTSSSLEVLTAQQQGASDTIPLDDALTDSERPLTPGLMYAMHGNARKLYARTGMAMACAYPEDITSDLQSFVVAVPENADTLSVWVYVEYASPPSGPNYIQIAAAGQASSTMLLASGWYGASFAVTGLKTVRVSYAGTGPWPRTHSACSAWFDDRDVTVYELTHLEDENGLDVVDELGRQIETPNA